MQTSVQRDDAVRFGSGVCEVYNGASWVNIGMITDAELAITKLIKQFIGANAKLPPKAKLTEVKFNFNLYEIDLTTINLLNGDGTYTTVSATPVNVTGEALGTGWTKDVPIMLTNKNGAGTEVSSIVIDEDGTPLVLDTDYSVFVDGNGYTWINPITAQTGVLDADYTYTPYASKKLEHGDADQTLNLQGFRFTNTNASGKIFRVEILKGYNSEGVAITFQGDEDEDPGSMAVSITAFPDDTAVSDSVNLFYIYDEQSIT